MGLIHQKEMRVARNNSLINDSSLTKIIDANTTVDSILSPKVSASKLAINRYGSNIRINENTSPTNQMSSKNLNYFGATNRGYRGSIIKLGKISPLSNRSRVQQNNFGSAIQQAGLSVLGSPVRVSLNNLESINAIIPAVHTIDHLPNS